MTRRFLIHRAVLRRFVLAMVALALVWPASASAGPHGQAPVNRDAQLQAEFQKRIQGYMDLHAAAFKQLPPVAGDALPAETDRHSRALARFVARSRARARQGDVFSSDIRAYFRRQIARALSGPDGQNIRASIMDENPGPIRIDVNGRYPDTAPLSSMPPQVLALLPKLPMELEYRFLGRRLILLDASTHLVVDYIDNALPG